MVTGYDGSPPGAVFVNFIGFSVKYIIADACQNDFSNERKNNATCLFFKTK